VDADGVIVLETMADLVRLGELETVSVILDDFVKL